MRTIVSRTSRPFASIRQGALLPSVVAALALLALVVPQSVAAEPPAPTILDDLPEPLVPPQPRSEADRDRLDAMAMFATARTLEHRGNRPEALRLYQRALRLDPGSTAIAGAIVSLAERMKRRATAVRYALLATEPDVADPLLLRRLGVHLTEQGRWAEAVKLYARTLAARGDAREGAADVLLQMEMGRLHHLVEQYDEAAEMFARVIEALEDPERFGIDAKVRKVLISEPGSTYALMGECFLLAGRPDEALKAFEESHRLVPNAGFRHLNLARVYLRTGRAEEGLAALEKTLEKGLADADALAFDLLGEACEQLGRGDEFVPRLERLREKAPDNAALGYCLAEQYLKREQFDRAEPLLTKLSETAATLAGYRGLIDVYRRTGRPAELLRVLGEVAGKTGSLAVLGETVERLAGDDEELDRLLAVARAADGQDAAGNLTPGMKFAAVLLAIDANRFEQVAELFDGAPQANPEQAARLFLSWGIALLLEDRAEEAAAVFRRAIDAQALPDDNPAFHYYLAGALAAAGQIDEALNAARKAVECKPDSPRYQSRVAWVHYYGKRHDEAFSAYRTLVERFDSDHGATETREALREARLALSHLCVVLGRLGEAEEWLEQVLDEFPDDVSAMNDLGYLWVDQGKHLGRALRMIEKALAAEPDNAAYRDSLGWAYYRLGRFAEAVAELEKAAADRDDAVVLDHLGDAYHKMNEADKAKEAWRRAADRFREEGEEEKARAVEGKVEKIEKERTRSDGVME